MALENLHIEIEAGLNVLSAKRGNVSADKRLGAPRNHRSYVVNVNGKLYWPLVKYLKLKA